LRNFWIGGSAKFSAKFDAIGAYSMINKGIFETCLGDKLGSEKIIKQFLMQKEKIF
jgi:hypothetical protein